MDVKKLTLLCAAFSLTACATTPALKQSPDTSSAQASGLSGRTLAAGDCGLFVWTADAQKKFVLYSQSQSASAAWLSPNGEVQLSVKDESGEPTQGQFPAQLYTSKNYGELRLNLREPQAISDGTRYRAGTLTMNDESGWARVTSVVGLSACKPAVNRAS